MAGQRILIVDDQKEATRLMRFNLESLGQDFIIDDLLSGEEALLQLARTPTDLLIADVRLPGISGLELMRRFKGRYPESKVILVSGVTDPQIRKQVAQAGADAFFFKPIDIPEFLDAVERALGLVETILQPELHIEQLVLEEEEHEQESIGMSEKITDLRVALDATAVLLVGDQGQVLVRAGELPDPELETTLMPSLMTAFHAAVHISYFLGQNMPDHLLSFRGENYDLFLTPVGEAYCLMTLTKPILAQELGEVAKQVQNTAKNVLLSLSRLGVSTHANGEETPAVEAPAPPAPVEEATPVAEKIPDAGLDDLLAAAGDVKKQDADAFWESFAVEEVKPELGSSDSLTYDQAAQLGLAPKDE